MTARGLYRTLALWTGLALAMTAAAGTGHRVGETAPEFTLPALAGTTYTLEQLRGAGHVLLVFWTTDCVYCYAHIKEFNQLHEQYNGKGLTVAAVNIGGEYPKQVETYVTDNGVKYLVLSDRLKNLDVAEAYKVFGTPTLVMVAPDGTIVWRGHSVPDVTQWITATK